MALIICYNKSRNSSQILHIFCRLHAVNVHMHIWSSCIILCCSWKSWKGRCMGKVHILCRWKAKILSSSFLILSQLPFCLSLKRGACSSVGIRVCSSSEQGSGPCQSHYITRPRLRCLAWPGWGDDYRRFVFPAFPSSSPLLLLLLPLRQPAYWWRKEGVCVWGTGKVLWHEVYRNVLITRWIAGYFTFLEEEFKN